MKIDIDDFTIDMMVKCKLNNTDKDERYVEYGDYCDEGEIRIGCLCDKCMSIIGEDAARTAYGTVEEVLEEWRKMNEDKEYMKELGRNI